MKDYGQTIERLTGEIKELRDEMAGNKLEIKTLLLSLKENIEKSSFLEDSPPSDRISSATDIRKILEHFILNDLVNFIRESFVQIYFREDYLKENKKVLTQGNSEYYVEMRVGDFINLIEQFIDKEVKGRIKVEGDHDGSKSKDMIRSLENQLSDYPKELRRNYSRVCSALYPGTKENAKDKDISKDPKLLKRTLLSSQYKNINLKRIERLKRKDAAPSGLGANVYYRFIYEERQ